MTETCTVTPEVIRESPLGKELSAAQCDKLADISLMACLAEGATLIEEGQSDEALFVVTQGTLEVVKHTGGDDWVTLQLLKPGDIAGELGFVDGIAHSATIRSISRAEVVFLKRTDLEGLLADDPELVYRVMRAIMRTVHGILRRMNLQFVEMSNYISKQHGRY